MKILWIFVVLGFPLSASENDKWVYEEGIWKNPDMMRIAKEVTFVQDLDRNPNDKAVSIEPSFFDPYAGAPQLRGTFKWIVVVSETGFVKDAGLYELIREDSEGFPR